jgi:hypothetical protein
MVEWADTRRLTALLILGCSDRERTVDSVHSRSGSAAQFAAEEFKLQLEAQRVDAMRAEPTEANTRKQPATTTRRIQYLVRDKNDFITVYSMYLSSTSTQAS